MKLAITGGFPIDTAASDFPHKVHGKKNTLSCNTALVATLLFHSVQEVAESKVDVLVQDDVPKMPVDFTSNLET